MSFRRLKQKIILKNFLFNIYFDLIIILSQVKFIGIFTTLKDLFLVFFSSWTKCQKNRPYDVIKMSDDPSLF